MAASYYTSDLCGAASTIVGLDCLSFMKLGLSFGITMIRMIEKLHKHVSACFAGKQKSATNNF